MPLASTTEASVRFASSSSPAISTAGATNWSRPRITLNANEVAWVTRTRTASDVEVSKHYPCVKNASVEYLVERPEPALTVSSDDLNSAPETAPRDPEELEARAEGPAPEISPLTTLGAVHLTVSDLNRSVSYYETAVGLETLEHADGRATLGVAARELLVLVEVPGAPPAAGYTGLYHFALLVRQRVDLARWLAHAARDRVPLTGLSDHFVSEAIYLTDPDGHGIEIYQDRPRETWEGLVAARMTTLPLDVDALFGELADPASEPFDGLPAGTLMGHVHLKVATIADTIGFYRDVLGFGLMAQLGRQAAFLSAGGYHHHIGANTWESERAPAAPEGSAALRHATIVLPSADERDRVLGRAGAAGAGAEETAAGPILTDPSGNRLLLAAAAGGTGQTTDGSASR
jgi:catechol 2,3-dioxygenase